ncbi:MAG: RidA family protein [Acidimicrobiia bacterium]|nr:RidA family protein [Acidimicrobiia bacterium]
MERVVHDPWEWTKPLGFVQAVEVRGAERVLECSGQVSFAPDGTTLHPDDMGGQLAVCLDNLETVLGEAGMTLGAIAKMTTFVTDMDAYFEHRGVVRERMAAAGAVHTHTLIGVAALARPDVVVEIDAVAYA